MKKLVCEMCGGTDFMKENGVFICQTCGMKYSAEEAKKNMVEVSAEETQSTAKNAQTDAIANRVKSIKVEYGNSNFDDVKQLCQEILNMDPDHYEAIVYKALSAGWKSSIANPEIVKTSRELCRANGILRKQYQDDNVAYTQGCVFPLQEMGRIASAMFANLEKYYNRRKSESNTYAAKYKQGQKELWNYITSDVYDIAKTRIDGYANTADKIESEAVDTYNGGCETVCVAVLNYVIGICNALDNDYHYCDGFLDAMQKCIEACDGYLTTDGVLEQYRSVLMHVFGLKIEAQNTYWAEHPEEKAAHDRKQLEEKKKAYADAVKACENAADDLTALKNAIGTLQSFRDFEDGQTKCDFFEARLEKLKAKADALEKERKQQQEEEERIRRAANRKKLKIGGIIAAALTVLATGFFLLNAKVLQPNKDYSRAVALRDEQKYDEAISAFEALNGYKDSAQQAEQCIEDKYNHALALAEEKNFAEARAILTELADYKDSAAQLKKTYYTEGESLMQEGFYSAASMAFWKAGIDDSEEKAEICRAKSGENKTIAAGHYLSLGLTNGGKVLVTSSGKGAYDVTDWENVTAVATDYHLSAGLLKNGTVICSADPLIDTNNAMAHLGYQSIISIAAGETHLVCLSKDGNLFAKGNNSRGQINIQNWRDIVAIAAGGNLTVGLKKDKTVIVTGASVNQDMVKDWTDIVAVATSGAHIIGLKQDGTVVAAGMNNDNQCDVDGWTDIVAVSAGDFHTVGLKSDGTVVACGANNHGQIDVSDWTDIVAIDAGFYHTVGLKKDGTMVATDRNTGKQCEVSGWSDIKLPD